MALVNYVFSYSKNTSNVILYNYYHLQMSVVTFWLNFKAKCINTGRKNVVTIGKNVVTKQCLLVFTARVCKQDLDSSDKETQKLPQSVRPGHLDSDQQKL